MSSSNKTAMPSSSLSPPHDNHNDKLIINNCSTKECYPSNSRSITAGALSGFISRLISHPLDVLKIRFQLQIESTNAKHVSKPKYTSLFGAVNKIFQEEGLSGFYKGHLNAQLLAISSLSLYFFTYESSMQFFAKIHQDLNLRICGNKLIEEQATVYSKQAAFHDVFRSAISGLSAGLLTMLVTYPLDTTRTRFSAQTNFFYTSIPGALQHIVKTEGFRGLYKGMMPALINNAPSSALFFGIYKYLNNLELGFAPPVAASKVSSVFHKLNSDTQNPLSMTSCFINSSIAAAVSKAITYPLDILQKRLQVQGFAKARRNLGRTVKYSGSLDCLSKILRQEGFLGFYKGYRIAIVRQILMYATSMSIYEHFKSPKIT